MIENKTQVLTNLRARIGLMLSLLSSIFVCCNQQEGNAKQFLPIDTIVSGFILDDYVNFNKRIQDATIKTNSLAKYGECIIFCNSDSSEYFILCDNYGGFAGQYDKFAVMKSSDMPQVDYVYKLEIEHFVSGIGAQINNNDDFLKPNNKQFKKIQNGDTLVYTIKNEYYPYHCEYKFIKGRLKYYEFDYRDP